MVRDPGLETLMRGDLGDLPGLRETPMFGGLCFLLNDHMLCAVRESRGMYRVGLQNEPAALALPDISPMVHGGRARPGYVWAHALAMADGNSRTQLTAMALQNAAGLPRKG